MDNFARYNEALNLPVGFPDLDKALQGGFGPGEFTCIVDTLPPGPKWDHENKTVDCSNPPRGPFEMGLVMQAYRDGWRVICQSV